MDFQLALITGATSGIGEALVELLASKGIPLMITGRNLEKLNELKEKWSRLVPVDTIQADLTSDEDRKKLIAKIHERGPNLVINNAGFGFYGAAIKLSMEQQSLMVDVNCKAILELTLEGARSMKAKGKKGVILNVSSAAAVQKTFPYFATYAATKAFINSLSISLDYELKQEGIRVLVSCPGRVNTDFSNRGGGVVLKRDLVKMTPAYAAERIWDQIVERKVVVIFDAKYVVLTYLTHLLPRSWVAAFHLRNMPH